MNFYEIFKNESKNYRTNAKKLNVHTNDSNLISFYRKQLLQRCATQTQTTQTGQGEKTEEGKEGKERKRRAS